MESKHDSAPPQRVTLERVENNAQVLRNMAEFWHYDFPEIFGTGLSEDGSFGSRGFDRLIRETECFLIRLDGHLAGLAYVQPEDVVRKPDRYFILRKYRRSGTGEEALRLLLHAHPDPWRQTVRPRNTGALGFWRKVLPRQCDEVQEHAERESEDGVRRIEFRFRAPT